MGVRLTPKSETKEDSMKLAEQIALKLSEEEKKDIDSSLAAIEKEKDSKMYHSVGLRTLFYFWRTYLPSHSQSIQCGGCRKTVHKFWKTVQQEYLNKVE